LVKTTVMLDDDLYRRLVKESIEKYGSTKKLSKLINEKLRERRGGAAAPPHKRLTMRLGRKLTEKELEDQIEASWGDAAKWTA
jgi:predicted CopG family antitoxin